MCGLSLGEIFSRVWNLRTEIKLFLEMKKKLEDFPQLFNNDWILDFAFAVDLLTHLNKLNTRLQRKGNFVHDLFHSVKAFASKLLLFIRQIEKTQFTHFNVLPQILPLDSKIDNYILQLRNCHADFSYRFDDFKIIESNLNLLSAPCTFLVYKAPENLQFELIDLRSNNLFSDLFNEVFILEFYAFLGDKNFSNLKNFAKKYLLFLVQPMFVNKHF